ncbi:uncharacterized protein LODBEIA_P32530 [Lodderomyces beijingensis]|uniref:Uncharacterized protein n=1 Tax=Lodderomyces beijingensis TaxID=1775926 RepID=A0ABP0ZLK6_9ASCO
MQYACFRVVLVFFSLATLILTAFAVAGSYKNKGYLTGTYLINFHLSGLDLRQIISAQIGSSKRDVVVVGGGGERLFNRDAVEPQVEVEMMAKRETTTAAPTPSNINDWINLATSIANQPDFTAQVASIASNAGISVPTSLPTDGDGGFYTTVQAAIADLLNNVTPEQLGIADVYSASYWGYCRGEKVSNGTAAPDNSFGRFLDENFDNSNVNYTWCSPPTAGFFFDPITIFKQEMNRTIDGISVDSQSTLVNELSTQYKNELRVLIDSITPEDLNLPGSLQDDLQLLNRLTVASFALMICAAALAFISIVIQFMGCCLSPDNCCLSFLNFMFQFLLFLLSILAAGLVTGTYVFVRRKINDEVGEWGIKSFLSINFYAFAWSAAASALLLVLFSLLGHCFGICGRRSYRKVQTNAAYVHHEK